MLSLILALALVGFCVWLILQIPMPQVFRNVIIGIVVVALIVYLLQWLGVNTLGLPHLRLMK